MTAGRNVNTNSRDWCTPNKYIDAVKQVLGTIHLDPCSNEYSIVNAQVEYRLPADGLKESWDYPTIYVNPPYGKDKERGTSISDWLYRCSSVEAEVLALIPVATNTGHWKKYIWSRATGICFLADTRLRFLIAGKDEGKGAPMACAMVYWGKNFDKFSDVFSQFGAVVRLR